MNNKGSGKAKLILLIPILIILLLLIVDTFISFLENKKLKLDTENIIREVMNDEELYFDDYYKTIKILYEQKKYDTDNLLVDGNENELYIENEQSYFGLFTSLKTYNYITQDVKLLGMNFKIIKSIKKIDKKYGEIKILGIKFRVRRGSKAFVKVTARRIDEENIEFEYTK